MMRASRIGVREKLHTYTIVGAITDKSAYATSTRSSQPHNHRRTRIPRRRNPRRHHPQHPFGDENLRAHGLIQATAAATSTSAPTTAVNTAPNEPPSTTTSYSKSNSHQSTLTKTCAAKPPTPTPKLPSETASCAQPAPTSPKPCHQRHDSPPATTTPKRNTNSANGGHSPLLCRRHQPHQQIRNILR